MSNIIPLFGTTNLAVRPRALQAVEPAPVTEADIDWKALASACGEVWPELHWSTSQHSVFGVIGPGGYPYPVHIHAYRGELTIQISPPTPKILAHPKWTMEANIALPLDQAPSLLRKTLLEGRRWWLRCRP